MFSIECWPTNGGKAGSPAGQPRWGAKPAFPTLSLSELSLTSSNERPFKAALAELITASLGWEGGLAPAG
jgi:hypothetical protein